MVLGNDKLTGCRNSESLISTRGFEIVNFRTAFAKPDGEVSDIGDFSKNRTTCDIRKEITGSNLDALGETDCLSFESTPSNKNNSYNQLSSQLIANYENWDCAQPAKDWCLTTHKTGLDIRGNLVV